MRWSLCLGRGAGGEDFAHRSAQGWEVRRGHEEDRRVAITRWPLMLPDGEATALVWDFGGQEIMHGTHQFFLTHRSLYLVVVDGRHDRAKQDAEYSRKLLIRAFGGQSPVLVVLNALLAARLRYRSRVSGAEIQGRARPFLPDRLRGCGERRPVAQGDRARGGEDAVR